MSESQIQQGLDQDNQPKKMKGKSSSRRENQIPVRKVRIIYTDPYATDDSDEDTECESNKPKRVVIEVNHPVYLKQSTGAETEKYPQKVTAKTQKALRPNSTPQKGIRNRKWGKSSARIPESFNRKKQGLGTNTSAEAEAKPYDMKKLEIDARRSENHSSPVALCQSHNKHAVSQDTTYAVDEPLDWSRTRECLEFEMELKCLFSNDDPVQLPVNSCDVKDLQVCGLEDSPPTKLLDFEFDFELSGEELAWMDEASNMIWP